MITDTPLPPRPAEHLAAHAHLGRLAARERRVQGARELAAPVVDVHGSRLRASMIDTAGVGVGDADEFEPGRVDQFAVLGLGALAPLGTEHHQHQVAELAAVALVAGRITTSTISTRPPGASAARAISSSRIDSGAAQVWMIRL